MSTIFKWALPLLIIGQLILFSLDILTLSTLILVSVIFEVLFALIAIRQFLFSVKVYSANRRQGSDKWTAVETSLEVFMPSLVAKLLASELRILYYLGLWFLRKIKIREHEFTYHRKSMLGAFVLLVLFITPAEIFIMGLLLPLEWLKGVLGILAVYAFFWMLGVWVSMSALPHRLGDDGLQIHNGVFAAGYIPYVDIDEIRAEHTDNLNWDSLKIDETTSVAYLSNGGTTDVRIRLKNPVVFKKWLSFSPPVTVLHIALDEPPKFLAEINGRLLNAVQPEV
ncbi:MAG: hypothetical protein ACRKGH_08420 [Dehalogenimonas sp.]